jgi:hypothetical protein
MPQHNMISEPDPRLLTDRQRALRDHLAHCMICFLTGEIPNHFTICDHEFGEPDPDAAAKERDARRATHKARCEMHVAKWTYRLADQLVARGHLRPFAMYLARKIQQHLDTCPNCWNGDELHPCEAYRTLLGSTQPD